MEATNFLSKASFYKDPNAFYSYAFFKSIYFRACAGVNCIFFPLLTLLRSQLELKKLPPETCRLLWIFVQLVGRCFYFKGNIVLKGILKRRIRTPTKSLEVAVFSAHRHAFIYTNISHSLWYMQSHVRVNFRIKSQ